MDRQFEPVYTPIIISAFLTPNPALVGETIKLCVVAQDVESIPQYAVYYAGEFQAGEV